MSIILGDREELSEVLQSVELEEFDFSELSSTLFFLLLKIKSKNYFYNKEKLCVFFLRVFSRINSPFVYVNAKGNYNKK